MLGFEDLDMEAQRNELLKGIHNQLAQINKWLEVIAVRYARLRDDESESLRYDAEVLEENLESIAFRNSSSVGYTQERGLYKSFMAGGKETYEPLGEYERTTPIDKETGFFIEED